ncbi:restriction endonuclease subunit S [Aeromonas hydrophila]|uniref:Restriction endonuclease subunit S n=1 Tax=Aeromonas hydrophila TaxID=644 RepID=A0AAX3PAA6_AERHY|nr:restriction endonuclease subunit S [Aeromonas hydrophila]WEE28442.1 restriction endonuclease subunit S [Aeromonas hydrophila]
MSDAVATSQQGLAGKYPPYPEYKDSGLEWLGEIPAHWNISRIKYVAQLNPSKSEVRGLSDDTIVSFIPMEAIGERGEIDVSRTRLLGDVLTGYSYITDGDVILAKITPCFENGKGAVVHGLENGIGFATTEVIPARPYRKCDAQFLYYLFTSNPFKALAEGSMYGAGGQKRVADSFVAEYHFAEAPTDERENIAAFLDYETARIDRLIAQQQRLIELLKEKRQAVISHAVTKGLNPNAPMKDSGVEWLGQVPEHWQCVPFGLLVSRADLGGNYLGGQEENGIPFLKMGNLGRGCIVLDKLECLEEGSSFDDAHRLSMGDFLFNTRNSLDLVGKVAVWHDELEFALYNSNLLRVRFKKDFISSPDFMGFVFNSSGALGWLALLAKGTTSVAAIYYKDLRSMVVPIPPVDEQNAISSFISKCLSRLDTLEEKAIQSINLMNERRTALISAAVTGKIDLRGWTPPADEVAA